MAAPARKRRPHGEVKNAMREYLARQGGGPASIPEITEAIRPKVGEVASSSIRSALQDKRVFERVERGIFKLSD